MMTLNLLVRSGGPMPTTLMITSPMATSNELSTHKSIEKQIKKKLSSQPRS